MGHLTITTTMKRIAGLRISKPVTFTKTINLFKFMQRDEKKKLVYGSNPPPADYMYYLML